MEYYKELLNNKDFSGIIVILDIKSNIIDANEQFLSLLGFTSKDIVNKHITDLIVPDEKSQFFDLIFTQDVSNVLTIKFYHKTGAFRFFSFSILNFNNHKILFGNTLKKDFLAKKFEYVSKSEIAIENIFENIELDNIRDYLIFENNPLTMVLDLMPIEIWMKDKIDKYVYVNKTYTKATGISLERCLLKDDFQLFSEDTAQSFTESDELAKKSKKKMSYTFETNDETISSFAEVTKIPLYNKKKEYIGMIGCSVNMSHIKASESLLETEKNRLMFVLDSMDIMAFEINSRNELEFISSNLKELIGIKMMNHELMELFLRSSMTKVAREKVNLALGGQKVILEVDIKGKNIKFTLNPIKNKNGFVNVIGYGEFISNEERLK